MEQEGPIKGIRKCSVNSNHAIYLSVGEIFKDFQKTEYCLQEHRGVADFALVLRKALPPSASASH